MLNLLEGSLSIKYLEFLSIGDLSVLHLFSDLCISLHLSVWIHGYLFGTLGYNSILYCCSACFSFGQWEFFRWHLCFFNISIRSLWDFFQYFLTFCHYKMQAHLIHLLSPVLDSAISHGRTVLKTKIQVLGMLIAPQCHCFQAFLGDRARKYICVYTYIYIFKIYMSANVFIRNCVYGQIDF